MHALCVCRYSCQIEHSYDGLTLDPYEVLFIKFKSFTLHGGLSSSVRALKLSQWQVRAATTHTQGCRSLLAIMAMGPKCKDAMPACARHDRRAYPGFNAAQQHAAFHPSKTDERQPQGS